MASRCSERSAMAKGEAAGLPEMLMTRRAWYTPRVREVVATREPVFTVRRQGSTLLAIYRVR